MRKIAYLLIISLIVSFYALGNEGPKVYFKETTKDLGIIPYAGKPVIYGFRFKNLGTAPLVIKNVRTDCSCLSAQYPTEPIMPGESGEITVKFNPGGYSGVFYKTYKVGTNDESNPNLDLMITGNLKYQPRKPTAQ